MSILWTPHPLEPVPTQEDILAADTPQKQAALAVWHDLREERIADAERDPVRFGYTLEQQQLVEEQLEEKTEVWVFGGNRSGKSYQAAKMVMKALLENPGTKIVCWAQDEFASVEMQQPYLWMMLPAEFRKKVKEQRANINWNDKTGFTGNKFVLPNGSSCVFRFYSQFSQNPKLIEGYMVGAPTRDCGYYNIGTWMDEYYGDEVLVGRLRRRCNDYNAKILCTFTPLDGHTPMVDSIMKGSVVKKTKYASLLDKEMPVVMEPTRENAGIVFFHTERNPFTNWERMKMDLSQSTRDEIMTVAYGYPVKSITTLFPTFNPQVNVIPAADFPDVMGDNFTRYMVIDPANARNYFALWAAVDNRGQVFVYREWPDRKNYGQWAEFGDPRWKPGPASRKIGMNVEGYADLFLNLEKPEEEIFERYVDSRFAATAGHSGTDLFTDFADIGFYVLPTDGQSEEKGLTRLDDWFSYDPTLPVDNANQPLCYIHEDCANLVDSLVNYGAQGKTDEALKDPIDCLRYLRMANHGDGIEHIGDDRYAVVWQGEGGY